MNIVEKDHQSTRLEGSFGTEKEHYGLKRIRARSPETQNVWAGAAALLLGLFTANVVRLAKKTPRELKLAA